MPWQSLLANPRDDTGIITHGTMVMSGLGFARIEDPAFSKRSGPGASDKPSDNDPRQ